MQNLHHAGVKKKRRKRIVFIAIAAIAFGLGWKFFHTREPVYKGHPLSEWVLYVPPSEDTADLPFQPKETEVHEAILTMSSSRERRVCHAPRTGGTAACVGVDRGSDDCRRRNLRAPRARWRALSARGRGGIPEQVKQFDTSPYPTVKPQDPAKGKKAPEPDQEL
jgi:hypothetical protein